MPPIAPIAAIRHAFEGSLRLGHNSTCRACTAKVKHPLLTWHVGSKWQDDELRPLFVGKSHRGQPGDLLASGCIDPASQIAELRESAWPFWSYTRIVAEKVFRDGEKGWEHIAISNLVKCTNVGDGDDSIDKTTAEIVEFCVADLGVIAHEITHLRPTHIVFYTYSFWPDLVKDVCIKVAGRPREIEDRRRNCGAKTIGWWTMEVDTPWATPMNVLVTGHPERQKKDDFTNLVATWITRTLGAGLPD